MHCDKLANEKTINETLISECVMILIFQFKYASKKNTLITFWNIGYSALYLVQANSFASLLEPGSCRKNWLHGNAKISKSENQQKRNNYSIQELNTLVILISSSLNPQ